MRDHKRYGRKRDHCRGNRVGRSSEKMPQRTAACGELDIRMGQATRPIVLENTPGMHNLAICTPCSSCPSMVPDLPPDWYKNGEYQSRAVREPRTVPKGSGTELSEAGTVRVHDSTADMRYLVLPMRPSGTEDWSKDALPGIVTRDGMIGVAC
jgi:hypothetical protein